MGNRARADSVRAKALIRDEKALALRMQHKSHAEIATALGYGCRQNAARAIKRRLDALDRECGETAEAVKAMELGRLDAMAAGLWKKAVKGDPQSVDRMLKIQERRSAYEGLDMPRALKVEVARELDSNLEKLKSGLAPDVYEQVLSVLAGEHGPSKADRDPDSAGAEEDRDPGEPG
jgi:hypothetical protein